MVGAGVWQERGPSVMKEGVITRGNAATCEIICLQKGEWV